MKGVLPYCILLLLLQCLLRPTTSYAQHHNEGFINRLTTVYPGLSMAEIRLCAMLRLQMTTKDIAEMINRSTRTIEHTRNKVRKKMNLSPGDNLLQHLLNI